MKIVIVDYGMGNLLSVQSKLAMLRATAIVSSKAEDIQDATKLILPGVGFFAEGIRRLRDSGLADALFQKVIKDKTPILGICLGMQLMTNHSEEGDADGLQWINGQTRRFNFDRSGNANLRIPHVGWNTVHTKRKSLLFKDAPDSERYYFTHSYYVECESEGDVVSETDYGFPFVSAIEKANVFGTQFHPEKSHRHGLKIIDNFLKYS